MKFLIVDDDQDILNITGRLLEMQGHEVEECNSALTAIQMLNTLKYDLVITDATMPAHSGFDLIRSIRKNKDLNYLTIAMLTGRRERGDIEQAMKLGVQDYIVKPIDPQVFLNKVESLVSRHKHKMKNFKRQTGPIARVKFEVSITRITDVGITVESPIFFQPGSTVEMDVPELLKVDIEKNKFKTLYSKPIVDSKNYSSEFLIMDLDNKEKNTMEQLATQWLFKKTG